MRIVGFLCNYNGAVAGHLRNCLYSMSLVTDQIVVYDDASTEDVFPIYDEFGCVVIKGRKNEFHRELFHKQELLIVAQQFQPDWILWFDSDAILGRHWENRERTESSLTRAGEQQIDIFHLHNLNLWRGNRYYRTDQSYDDLWHGVWWRNTGQLHYDPLAGLHQKQYPLSWLQEDHKTTFAKFDQHDGQLLHFGFSSEEDIARKYFTYRDQGQKDWALTRLVDEVGMQLVEADADWYPEWYPLDREEAMPVEKFTPEHMEGFANFDEWLSALRGDSPAA